VFDIRLIHLFIEELREDEDIYKIVNKDIREWESRVDL